MHAQYKSHLFLGLSPQTEFLRNTMAFTVVRALVEYYFECSLKESNQSKKKPKYLQ